MTATDVPCVVPRRQPLSPTAPGTITWTDVYQREREGLIRLAYLMTGSQAVAEDLVQDTFIRVMKRLEADSEPGAYLRRSVINACYSWHRRHRREVIMPDPEAEFAYQDRHEVELWDALARLAPRRRTVLILRYYLDLSEAEVASTMGCRIGTVKSTSHRALQELRRMLEK